MSGNPTFSICIPSYNYARFLGETIRSVLAQTYPHFEIVVADNASTDDSVAVVESFQSDRIRLVRNRYNVGFAPNLDRAVQPSRNEFVIVLSADDLMRPTALEEYARVILALGERAAHALITSAVDQIDETGTRIGGTTRLTHFRTPPDADLTARVGLPAVAVFSGLAVFKEVFPRMGVPGTFCATAFSRALYDRVGGYASLNTIGPDAHFAYKAMLEEALVVFVDRPLFAYRVHTGGQLGQDRKMRSLRVPIDRYAFTLQYSDEQLARAGVSRNEIVEFSVDDACLKTALREVAAGDRGQGFRLLMFALASYPGTAIRNWKVYALALTLAAGPAGTWATRKLLARRRRQAT